MELSMPRAKSELCTNTSPWLPKYFELKGKDRERERERERERDQLILGIAVVDWEKQALY